MRLLGYIFLCRAGCAALVLFAACFWALELRAGERTHGLLWNRTGLPLVFPLQVATADGVDLRLTLIDAETGAPALAAAIEGGRFFRVLTPPGAYLVHLGRPQGDAEGLALFGPLRFAVRDHDRKGGYRVDLTRLMIDGAITIAPFDLCQGVGIERLPRPQAPFDDVEGYARRIPPEGSLGTHPDAVFDPERLSNQTAPSRPTEYAPYLSTPRFAVRNRPC